MQNSLRASFRKTLLRQKAALKRQAFHLRESRHVKPTLVIATLLHTLTGRPVFAAARLHCLYLLNQQDTLQKLCRQIMATTPNLSSTPLLLQTLLKAAWNVQDDDILEAAVRAVADDPKPALRNVHFIAQRKNANPMMQAAIAQISSAQHASLESAIGLAHREQVDASLARLEAIEDISVAPASLMLFVASSTVCRYLARIAMQDQEWLAAEKWLRRARNISPQDLRNYRDLGDLALRYPDAPSRIDTLLEQRSDAAVREVGVDPLMGQKHLLSQDYLSFLRLRDDQVSNQVARAEYKSATAQCMGRSAVPFEKTNKSAFVIGRDGVSDEVRWAYYFSQLPKFYKQVSISCDPRLQPLLERSFPTVEFFPVARNWGRTRINSDNRLRNKVPNLELATRLDNAAFASSKAADHVMFIEDVATRDWKTRSLSAPPASGAPRGRYLQPDPKREAYWGELLNNDAQGGLKVGLIWRSGLTDAIRSRHYLTLQDLLPLAQLDIKLYSIQHQITDDEKAMGASVNVKFNDESIDFYNDFEEIAAFTANLDLIIGVSTLPFEIAGAVGTECWLCALSPEGPLLRRGEGGSGPDRLTCNGSVFVPEAQEGYQMSRHNIVADILTQIQNRILARE